MWRHGRVANLKWRRTGLLLAGVVLLFAVFAVNALVAWVWPQEPAGVAGLIAFDIAGFVAIFAIFHSALDPPNQGSPPPGRFKRNSR